MTACSVVLGYQRFKCPCCFHIQGEVDGFEVSGTDLGLEWREVAGGTTQ